MENPAHVTGGRRDESADLAGDVLVLLHFGPGEIDLYLLDHIRLEINAVEIIDLARRATPEFGLETILCRAYLLEQPRRSHREPVNNHVQIL